MNNNSILVLGGAGLVGTQIVSQICEQCEHGLNSKKKRIGVGSLREGETRAACAAFSEAFGIDKFDFVPIWGNLFVSSEFADQDPRDLESNSEARGGLLEDLYGEFEGAYQRSRLREVIFDFKPEVVFDCINTATSFAYRDIFDGATKVREWIQRGSFDPHGTAELEALLLSQSVPQLVRHVMILHRALCEVGVQSYIKIGTTGTGGMGLNVPYTHSEDRPSKKLFAKTEAAFGHSGLLFLAARTPGGPIVKEIKPAAMIGYRSVAVMDVQDRRKNRTLFSPRAVRLEPGTILSLQESESHYLSQGSLRIAVVDTGENGLFTRGEFAAITALGQMEFITPEEVADIAIREAIGHSTGRDVIAALNSSVIDPSYKAGLIRQVALSDLERVEAASRDRQEAVLPSIALGRLGPPELSKLLFEAWLLRECYEASIAKLATDSRTDLQIALELARKANESKLASLAVSIGIPVLQPDGVTLFRGPWINVPEIEGHRGEVELSFARDDSSPEVDEWAPRGWIDLRPQNIFKWRSIARSVCQPQGLDDESSESAAARQAFQTSQFEIGDLVAWIHNNLVGGRRLNHRIPRHRRK